jgi:hypothetical protein
LEVLGLIKKSSKGWTPTDDHIQLESQSYLNLTNHTNWRNHAITTLHNPRKEDTHYTAALSLSKADFKSLRQDIIGFLDIRVGLSPLQKTKC